MLGDLMALVGTTRPEEAKRFYRDTLGLKLVSDEEFAIVFDSGGTMLRVSKAHEVKPAPYSVLSWKVKDIEKAAAWLVDRGVKLLRYAHLPQDERGIWTSPDGVRIVWFHDPDENVLGLVQFSRA